MGDSEYMVYDDLIVVDIDVFIEHFGDKSKHYYHPINHTCGEHYIRADYEKLMLYTGLKDKNNVEVFEGDILKETFSMGCSFLEVKFGKYKNGKMCDEEHYVSGLGFYVQHYLTQYNGQSPFKQSDIHPIFGDYFFSIENTKIKGNVYQSPELLKNI